MHPGRRLGASFAASALLHVVELALLVHAMPEMPRVEPAIVIPIALFGGHGGGTGGGPAPEPQPAPAPMEPPAPPPTVQPTPAAPPRPRPRVVARHVAPSHEEPTPSPTGSGSSTTGDAVASLGGTGGGSGGAGSGPGAGGGNGGVAYAANPPPPYPLVARRLGKEGLVLLEVVVAPDGRAAAVRVLRSSGFPPLDDAAMTTVRDRWRFVPARQGGTPVESRVTVPIRFRLEDAS